MLRRLMRMQSSPQNAAQMAGRAHMLSTRIVHTMAWPRPAPLPNVNTDHLSKCAAALGDDLCVVEVECRPYRKRASPLETCALFTAS